MVIEVRVGQDGDGGKVEIWGKAEIRVKRRFKGGRD